jgi:hypothetical protein
VPVQAYLPPEGEGHAGAGVQGGQTREDGAGHPEAGGRYGGGIGDEGVGGHVLDDERVLQNGLGV